MGFTHLIFDIESQHPICPKTILFEYALLDCSNEIYYRNATTSYIHTIKNNLQKNGKIKGTFIKIQIIHE